MYYCSSRIDDVEGIELPRWEDQQKIRNYVESGGPPKSKASKDTDYGIEVSQTSRATCRQCGQKIMKGEVGFYVSINVIVLHRHDLLEYVCCIGCILLFKCFR